MIMVSSPNEDAPSRENLYASWTRTSLHSKGVPRDFAASVVDDLAVQPQALLVCNPPFVLCALATGSVVRSHRRLPQKICIRTGKAHLRLSLAERSDALRAGIPIANVGCEGGLPCADAQENAGKLRRFEAAWPHQPKLRS